MKKSVITKTEKLFIEHADLTAEEMAEKLDRSVEQIEEFLKRPETQSTISDRLKRILAKQTHGKSGSYVMTENGSSIIDENRAKKIQENKSTNTDCIHKTK